MPTPLEILLDPISLWVLALYASLMLWEAIFPARPLPKIRGWKVRALGSFAVFFFLSSYLPLIWDPVLAGYQLFDLSGWGVVGGALAGLVVYEGLVYFWHRAMHSNVGLWRSFHQMHHSAERIDTYGAFYFHPLDMAGFTLLGSLALALVFGVTPQAATLFLFITFFLGVFQHANIRTPRWLGYLIQRPESHGIHHARKVHYKNFSDLPVFDMVFGTFENPKGYEHEAGFYEGASARIPDMLMFRDVSKLPMGREPGQEASARIAPAA
ncbi:MAG: sterol desaturase family protein [Xanthomonadales bacterium]|nr:sterol desaturase family protein [Gammaproteobacteria bacterium]NNE05301.1 sterol desaturase family protein [Xanthomonadales bacterium]NNL95211.1 sterol desaturase family protein [Xanthomonadales bacterium]